MEISGESLDEILVDLYRRLLESGGENSGSRGDLYEFLGVSLRLTRPRSRVSLSESRGKPFSALAELFWYLSGSGDLEFIEPYIPEYRKEARDGIIPGAYGPRIFRMRSGINQLDSVANLLKWNPTSKRAVVQIFNAEDIALDYPASECENFYYPETPCTVSLQFHLRDGRLHLAANMRSNDAFKGLPHDVFCFTMIQEMMARRLNADLGEYLHYAGSMHIYNNNVDGVRDYLTEGHHKIEEMPEMPQQNPFDMVGDLLAAEKKIRSGQNIIVSEFAATPYWSDMLRMFQAFWASGDDVKIDRIKSDIAPPLRIFVEGRRDKKRRASAVANTSVNEE
jgi:thymidylate synthase